MSLFQLPKRPEKPRKTGITSLLDPGLPVGTFEDTVKSYGHLIDYVKLGWGTALVCPGLHRKLELAREHDIEPYLGGTLFEKALVGKRLDDFKAFITDLGLTHVEISNGTVDLGQLDKARHIERFCRSFTVISEVGYKDTQRSLELHPARWVQCIKQDMAAGAEFVVAEARESGRSGICRADGEVRFGLIEEILAADINSDRLIFEAPTKSLQVYFIGRVGPNVNLGNIAARDVVSLETIRLGLRSETLLSFDADPAKAAEG